MQIAESPGTNQTALIAHCKYCQYPLNAFFYFCLGCGTPYKKIESVLPLASPRPLTEGELIELKAPGVAPLFWSYFSVVFGCGLFSWLFFRENRPDLQLFLNDTAIFVTTCVFASMYWRSLTAQFKQIGFDQPAAYVGLALLAGLLLINWSYHEIWERGWNGTSPSLLERLRAGGTSEAVLIMSFCIFPAVTEEISFRGLLQHWLQTAIRPSHALVFSSFLFSVLHFSLISFPVLFCAGLLLGWVKWKTNSLYPSMIIHFVHNYVVIQYF